MYLVMAFYSFNVLEQGCKDPTAVCVGLPTSDLRVVGFYVFSAVATALFSYEFYMFLKEHRGYDD